MPIMRVSTPSLHHVLIDHMLLREPITKKVAPENTMAQMIDPLSPKTKGKTGMKPHTMNAINV